MKKEIFDRINQISLLKNETRMKIVIALFNFNIKIYNQKLGIHSHSLKDLTEIIGVSGPDLCYHIDILRDTNLITKSTEDNKSYSITDDGKKLLRMFGISNKKVREIGENILMK